jgi:hypothetical protein
MSCFGGTFFWDAGYWMHVGYDTLPRRGHYIGGRRKEAMFLFAP